MLWHPSLKRSFMCREGFQANGGKEQSLATPGLVHSCWRKLGKSGSDIQVRRHV